ncbi:hypothetical protein V5O48_019030 [Marasmius crinis-equi]|uniref:Uncharacterized protein n=1 Tax=Marasmius crinis-equi TaxID=585013 RepID=A0ABR3EJL7_9AGAR
MESVCIRRADLANGLPARVRIAVDAASPDWSTALKQWGINVEPLHYSRQRNHLLTTQMNFWSAIWWLVGLLGGPQLGDVKNLAMTGTLILANDRKMHFYEVALEALGWRSLTTITDKDYAFGWAEKFSRMTWNPKFPPSGNGEQCNFLHFVAKIQTTDQTQVYDIYIGTVELFQRRRNGDFTPPSSSSMCKSEQLAARLTQATFHDNITNLKNKLLPIQA